MRRIYLTEEQHQKLKNLIYEELGSFENQYEIATYVTKHALKMLRNGISHDVVSINDSIDIKNVDLTLFDGASMFYCQNFDIDTQTIFITIGTHNLENEELLKKVPNRIGHELMHGNIYLKKFSHVNPYNDIPNYYDALLDVMNDYSKNGTLVYYFAYGLYSTWFQETNAFVSQVSGEILDKSTRYKKITIKDFHNLYKSTNSVEAFNTNINYAEYIYKLSDNAITSFVINHIDIENLTPSKVRKMCKEIIDTSKKALKDCRRNAMIALNKLKDEGRLFTQ